MRTQQEEVFAEVAREREAQDYQWGGPKHDDEHVGQDWCDFIAKQLKDARLADRNPTHAKKGQYRRRMVKVAALAIAAIESYDRCERLGRR